MTKILGIVLIGAALLFVVTGLGGCVAYNSLVAKSQGVDKQWAQVENVYQRRADLIPNLVSTVSGAAAFEKSTITEVTAARASVGQLKITPGQAPLTAEQLRQFQAAQDGLSSALSRLLVVVERYPDLTATANFRDLQAQLEGTENRITVERQRFNEAVQSYNTSVKTFPTVLFAGVFGHHARPYFQAVAGSEQAPKVEFDLGQPGDGR